MGRDAKAQGDNRHGSAPGEDGGGGTHVSNDGRRERKRESLGRGLLVTSVSNTRGTGDDDDEFSDSEQEDDIDDDLTKHLDTIRQAEDREMRGSRRSVASMQIMELAVTAASDAAAGSQAHSNLMHNVSIVSHTQEQSVSGDAIDRY